MEPAGIENSTVPAQLQGMSLDPDQGDVVTFFDIEQGIRVASGGFELRMGTDRKTGDAVLRAGWHKSAPDPLPPLPVHLLEAPRASWTDAEVHELFARLPARERRRIRSAAIRAGCEGTEWQRYSLLAAKVLLALPAAAYLACIGVTLAQVGFDPITLIVSAAVWLVPFSTTFLFFTLIFVAVKGWALRTAELPLHEEFEMLLNRIYPLRRQIAAAEPASGSSENARGSEIERLAERAAS